MSGLAGLLRTGGAPVHHADLDAMTATMAHRGPHGGGRWLGAADGHAVGLALLRLDTGPPGTSAAGPVVDPTGQVVLTLDGRIDDRAGLRRDLGSGPDLARACDADLVLAAYLRWGVAGLGRVVGELAVAIWDGRHRRVVLARDFLGQRPLLYHHGPSGLRWASEPQAVLADDAVPRTVDAAMALELLSTEPRSRTATLFSAVRRVTPAHALVWEAGRTREERIWAWDPSRVAAGDADDQVTAFVEVLTEAVAAALDAPGPVAAELSGGLDSSSVVALAERLRRDGRAAGPLEVLSLVFPGQPQDETRFIRAVAGHCGVEVAELEPAPAGAEHYLAQIRHHADLPEPPNMAMHRSLHATALARGARVLLTGQGGDEWLTGSRLALADALRGLRLRRAWRTARLDRQVFRHRGLLHQLARDGLEPLLPAPAHRLADRLLRGDRRPRWIRAEAWRAHDMADRLRPVPLRGPSLATAEAAAWLEHGFLAWSTESAERSLARTGLEARSPFRDRRVVEAALALPESTRRRGPATKWPLRAGLAGVLPDEVRGRPDMANFVPVFHAELVAQGGGRLFRDLALEEVGWVDGAEVRRCWEELEAAHRRGSGHPWVWALWNVLSTERWFRAIVPVVSI